MTTLIKVPIRFYQDHNERGLPTPVNHSRSKTHAVIAANDPAMHEFLSDVRYYADPVMDDFWQSCPGVKRSAIATLRAIQAAASGGLTSPPGAP